MSDADFAEIEQQLRRAHEALINQASIETTLRAEVERLREAGQALLNAPLPAGKYTMSGPTVVFFPLAAVMAFRDVFDKGGTDGR